jgi:putative SOS response-associated peptidase YedK
MCGLYTLSRFRHPLLSQLEAEQQIPRWKAYPGDPALVMGMRDGKPAFDHFVWGYRAKWMERKSEALINAKAETVRTLRTWKGAFVRRRCLVPADGFYEPLQDSKPRRYFYFQRINREPCWFAGLWTYYDGPGELYQGQPYKSFAIITTAPNQVVSPVHGRMPALIPESAHDAWLDPDNHDLDALEAMLSPAPDDEWEGWEVAPDLYKRSREDATVCEPIGPVLRHDGSESDPEVALGR